MTGVADPDFERAVALSRAGRHDACIALLVALAERYPEDPAPLGMLGHVYGKLERYDDAVQVFRAALELEPRAEAASLGIFHSLWELGEYEAALVEMRRFLGVQESQQYRDLVKDVRGRLGKAVKGGPSEAERVRCLELLSLLDDMKAGLS